MDEEQVLQEPQGSGVLPWKKVENISNEDIQQRIKKFASELVDITEKIRNV